MSPTRKIGKTFLRQLSCKLDVEQPRQYGDQRASIVDKYFPISDTYSVDYGSDFSYKVWKFVCPFYRAMHFSAFARSWDRMSSVRLSVGPSVL